MKNLSDLGERQAIQLISEILTKGNTAVDLGDDCAAIELGDDLLLITTDMISEKTHIHKEMTPYQIGWFSVAINLSDIAAKAGTPLGIVLSYGLPKQTTEHFLTELTKGADNCATTYNTTVLGGDMKETQEIIISGTAFGMVKKQEFMPRKGAQVGDIIAVTGTLGKAGAAYHNITHNLVEEDISTALFEPQPKLKEGQLLGKQHCITSCMDLSDGLSASLYQLLELNNTGFIINQSDLPIAQELLLIKGTQPEVDMYDIALHFGGDYELLLTLPPHKLQPLQKIFREQGLTLTSIGFVIKEKKIYLKRGASKKILDNKGYEHFKPHHF